MNSIMLAGQIDTVSVLKFADPLTDNMVVQQNKAFTVWGNAGRESEVVIKADWTSPVTVKADKKGGFKGIIPVPEAKKGDFTKHRLSIISGGQTKVLNNILIGEVWICSGQSNMQFAMKEVVHAAEELKKTDHPNIRLFNTGLNFSNTPILNVSGHWQECSPETVEGFSAVGYYFGKKLYDRLKVPVGLLFTGIGASACQAYLPREVLAGDRLLDSVYLAPYLRSGKSKEKIDGGFSFEKVTRPYLLYNAMINPFKNLSIRGVIWYQGESNRKDRLPYTRAMYKMITSWREKFGQGNFPFYYVQVAPFFYDQEDPALADYAFFREQQEKISKLDHTAMVVTMDVGEAKNLHPKDKKPVGERLAGTALHKTYNDLDEPYLGPHFQHVVFEGKKAVVSFIPETILSGLTTNDGKAPKFFQLAGKDQVFYPAAAKIEGNKIIVTSKRVKSPVAVRYAFTNYPVTNLENSNGLPAVPFRSDRWDEKGNNMKD
ncbi:sialate O-acetylesterase [Sinomicrobium sp. FJxs]|uniref:Sialate O-acetylesterase n=2 Tax=Sinomicrobium weinanense TaxID=2842200 RepID=A0A926Q315_9FLAO|nr:sialate O-acetylesterase [Sinomicrobium weinanense]